MRDKVEEIVKDLMGVFLGQDGRALSEATKELILYEYL